MTVNQLPNIPVFWYCNNFVGNVGIQNISARTRYQADLQSNHFGDNKKQDKTDKGHKIRPSVIWMNHFKQYFQTIVNNVLRKIWQNSKDVPVSYPNIVKFYNDIMDGVDIMDKKTAAWRLDGKSKYRFYLIMLILWTSHM